MTAESRIKEPEGRISCACRWCGCFGGDVHAHGKAGQADWDI